MSVQHFIDFADIDAVWIECSDKHGTSIPLANGIPKDCFKSFSSITVMRQLVRLPE